MDEFGDMRPSLWFDVIRPMLADRKGWAVFIGTPKGKNAFWDLWSAAQTNDAWFTCMLKASETGIIAPDELAEMRRDMGEDAYLAELQCSFEAAIKGAFYGREMATMLAEKRIGPIPIEPAARVHTAWDLGVSDSTAIWFIQCIARERRLVDYYESSGVGLDHYKQVLLEKASERGWTYGEHFLPHDVTARELTSGLSRKRSLEQLPGTLVVVRQHDVLDGINAVRKMLGRTWIDDRYCARGIETLRQYRREYDEKLKDYKQSPLHDWSSHGADALRTFAAGFDDPEGVREVAPRNQRSTYRPSGVSSWAS